MNRTIRYLLLAFALGAGGGAFAANGDDSVSDSPLIIEAERPEIDEATSMKTQKFAIGPQLGVINYTDNAGEDATRGMVGVGLDWNLAPMFGAEVSNVYFGLQSGINVAKVGGSGANFFGGDSDPGTGLDDATLLMAPVNAKLGYNISDRTRISAHGGGNVFYRSSAGAVRIADDDPVGNESEWDVHPNVGADLEMQIGDNVGLLARPDFTISDETLFVGTLAANFMF